MSTMTKRILQLISCAIVFILALVITFVVTYHVVSYDNFERAAEKNSEIIVYVDEALSSEQAMSVGNKLLSVEGVADAKYISKTTAQEEFAEYIDSEVVMELPTSIFRDRYLITLSENADYDAALKEIRQIAGISKVVSE